MKQFFNKYRNYIALAVAAVLVGIDRYTKWLVLQKMSMHEIINLIKIGNREILNLYYCTNKGSAFSMLEGQTFFLIIATSIILILLIIGLITKRIKNPWYVWAATLVMGGGIGNLIDRIFNNGYVVDFIDFHIIRFPIFNFADICAVCGAGILMTYIVREEIREKKAKKLAKASKDKDTPSQESKNGNN